jgi:hypothetical protein
VAAHAAPRSGASAGKQICGEATNPEAPFQGEGALTARRRSQAGILASGTIQSNRPKYNGLLPILAPHRRLERR